MADKKKKKSSKSNNLPKGMKVSTRRGGETEEIESEFKSTGGPILFMKKGDSFTVAMLQTPKEWTRFEEHAIPRKDGFRYVPCAGPKTCLVEKRIPDNEAKTYAMIPMYVYDLKTVKLFRAPGGAVNELMKTFKRVKKKGFLTRQFIFERNDETNFVTYEFERLDKKVKEKEAGSEVPDIDEIINERMKYNLNELGWLSKASLQDEDEDDDEEEIEDEDEDEDDIEDDEDDEDEDDIEDDEDDEDEDEEDEEDELPPKKKKKSKKKKGKK